MAEITGMSGPVTKIDVMGGVPGAAGVSVTTAELNADGHLLISKSNGTTTDVGKVKFDVTPEVQAAWDGAVAAETEATTQAGIATVAASNAKDSETKAAASAAAASGAAASEAAAKTSETNAALSASNAATSAETATTKAGIATSAATAAATSASNAALSESAAATSESNAATAASNAATSESNAATSESHAASSASAAAGSATSASSSATAASGSANAAALSATAASGSATAAATSAGQAAGSATAAASAANTAITTGLATGGSIKAAIDAGDAATLASAARYELRGTGSPYGVVTPPGAGYYYTDAAGTCGAWRWISTGTTKTSWEVVNGDTGWRNLSSLLVNGFTGKALIRRTGRTVSFALWNFDTTAKTSWTFINPLPLGFSPSVINLALFNASTQIATARSYERDFQSPVTAKLGDAYNGQTWNWITSDIWPTSLPGTAV